MLDGRRHLLLSCRSVRFSPEPDFWLLQYCIPRRQPCFLPFTIYLSIILPSGPYFTGGTMRRKGGGGGEGRWSPWSPPAAPRCCRCSWCRRICRTGIPEIFIENMKPIFPANKILMLLLLEVKKLLDLFFLYF
jgi:hypothetical protein